MSLKSFSDYLSTNTIKNPIYDLFPNLKGQPKLTKEPVVKKAEDLSKKVKDSITDIKSKATPYVWLGIIGIIVYAVSKHK
jgi:hypothetical protein